MSINPASPSSPTTVLDGGAPRPADSANAAAPAPEACPLCGAPLPPEQEWCLRCGAAARTRLATSSNWKAPIIAVAVVATLSLGVLAASLVKLAGNFGSTATSAAVTVTVTAGAVTPTTTTAAPGTRTPSTTVPGTTTPAGNPGTASGPLSTEPTVKLHLGPPPATTQIRELITGTGPEALPGDMVSVNYVGVLYKGGAQFDSSWRRGKRFTFALGTGQVIAGWNQGVTGMKVGGRRELVVPASAAYGAKGLATRPVGIPPNAALVFVVDLLEVSSNPSSTRTTTPAKKR